MRLVPLIAFVALLGACTSVTAPGSSSIGLNLSGTWSGDLTVQGQTARMTWTLTQTGTSVRGPVLIALSNGIVLLNGSLSGTLADHTLTYTITIEAGGIPSLPSCSGQLDGIVTATVGAASTLAGNYAVTSSTCPSPLAGGAFTLTKQ